MVSMREDIQLVSTYVICAGSSFGVLKAKQNSSSGARVTDKVATVDDTPGEGDAPAAEVVATCVSVVAGIFVLPVLAGGEVTVGGVAAAPDGVLPRSFCAAS